MWQSNGDARLRELVEQAATAVYRARWRTESSVQCHGLAGNAELLLDVADATRDSHYRHWAHGMARAIGVRQARRRERALLPDERARDVSASFNIGSAGTLAFLLRLDHGGPRPWLPHSLAGAPTSDCPTTDKEVIT
ncbi:lanthionine synthetase LanC family protein [Streptomyces sp. R11]|uniref:Lanthionine synthetase LanC family protein n=1 Tax=Streptomyces sp. R11 TaxID=3238625 RepID=A0AB39NGI7_9ACTN